MSRGGREDEKLTKETHNLYNESWPPLPKLGHHKQGDAESITTIRNQILVDKKSNISRDGGTVDTYSSVYCSTCSTPPSSSPLLNGKIEGRTKRTV